MATERDYRNSPYCPCLVDVKDKKRALEERIKTDSPKTKIMYNKISKRGEEYHPRFAEIYNKKCAYCGILWGPLPAEMFEVDHYINEDSFPQTVDGRAEAGKVSNLVWSCSLCNRWKSGLTIAPPYDQLLDPDDGSISNVFKRDEEYNIVISDDYSADPFVKTFYRTLHLGAEVRRLDYLLLRIYGKLQCEKDPEKVAALSRIFIRLLEKRNTVDRRVELKV